MKINIKFRGKIFPKEINETDSVKMLSDYLQVRIKLEKESFQLKYGSIYLLENKKFQNLGIKENDLIEVITKDYELVLSHEGSTMQVVKVKVKDSMTVKELYDEVSKALNTERDKLNLKYEDNYLFDETVLLEKFNFFDNATIFNETFQVVVRMNQRRITIAVRKDMTLKELKRKIKNKFGVTRDDMQLKWQDKNLENDIDTMLDYGIENCSELDCIMDVEGGQL